MLDPSIWEDPDFGSLTMAERLLFIGLLSHADDEGIGDADIRVLRRAVFGFDDTVTDAEVETWLAHVNVRMRGLELYEFEGRRYYWLKNWRRYQKVSHPTATKYPRPPEAVQRIEARDNGFARVMFQWEKSMPGMISPAIADELQALAEEWDEHVRGLEEGHPDRRIGGYDAVVEVIAEGVRSVERPNVNYLKAIMKSWIASGFKNRDKPKSTKEKPKAATGKTLSREDLARARRKKS